MDGFQFGAVCISSTLPLLSQGDQCSVAFAEDAIGVMWNAAGQQAVVMEYPEVSTLQVEEVEWKKGGGFIGGGFGLAGMAAGMATAGALNLITSRKKRITLFKLGWSSGSLVAATGVPKAQLHSSVASAFQQGNARAQARLVSTPAQLPPAPAAPLDNSRYSDAELTLLSHAPRWVGESIGLADGAISVDEVRATALAIGMTEDFMMKGLSHPRAREIIATIRDRFEEGRILTNPSLSIPADAGLTAVGALLDKKEEPTAALEVKQWLGRIGLVVGSAENGVSNDEVNVIAHVSSLLGIRS